MSGGRKPKPTALKILQGTFQKCRANGEEPEVKLGAPEMPKYLKGPAKKEWERLIVHLTSTKILAEQEQGMLALLCLLHGKMVDAARRGELLPAALIAQYRNLAACFGLTPSDRARVKVPKGKKVEADTWANLAKS